MTKYWTGSHMVTYLTCHMVWVTKYRYVMSKNCFNIKGLIGSKWFVLLFNTAFFALMAWLLPMYYEENDDIVMCMIANGGLSGSPDGHLVL